MRTVRISERAARALLEHKETVLNEWSWRPDYVKAFSDLELALRRLKSPKHLVARKSVTATKAAKRKDRTEARLAVRMGLVARAQEKCEACETSSLYTPLEMDHFFGRARSESVETCWLLCRWCHGKKTDNKPDAAHWLRLFRAHCDKHGYDTFAVDTRLGVLEVADRLDAIRKGAP